MTALATRSAAAATPLRVDTQIWPSMTRLAECLCTEIIDAGLPETCFCGILPGADVATDYVTEDAGMAWVRLGSAYPYSAFPLADNSGGSCRLPLAFQIEVGAAWCAPVFADAQGSPPALEDQYTAAEIEVAAMAAMHRAITCCFPTERAQVALAQYQPFGPQGAVVGGTWSLFVSGGLSW